MPSTAHIVALLDELLGPGSVELARRRDVRTLALALDPPPHAALAGADALLVHRSYDATVPPGTGLVGCHDPLDRALGLAHNDRLHRALGCGPAEVLDEKLAVAPCASDVEERLRAAFGGLERTEGDPPGPGLTAFADALRPAMVEAASAAGATRYVTGTWRPSAAGAVAAAGMRVLVVGHRRQEEHSLATLARLLRDATGGDLQTTVCTR